MAPFYGWGSTASRLQPLRGGSLLFTIQFPEIFIDLAKMKGCVDLGVMIVKLKMSTAGKILVEMSVPEID